MKKTLKKILYLTFALMVLGAITSADVLAYGIAGVHNNDIAIQTAASPGDIRHGVGLNSNHEIEFTLDATGGQTTTITENETIVLTFRSGSDAGEFHSNLNTATIDFTNIEVKVAGVSQTCAAVAAATAWGCAVTTDAAAGVDGVITITSPTTGPVVYAAAGVEMSVEIGNGTTGAVQLINPTVASKDAHGNEADAVEANMYKVTINGTFGTEGGVIHGIKAAYIWPVLSDDQVHVYAYVAPELTFDLDSGDTSYNNGNNTSLGQLAGTADDDDTVLDFFTQFANSIDFGMPSSTAATFGTPTHPNYIMDGGDSASNIDDGGAHGFHVGTNAAGGLVTTVWGETLTNGTNTIDAIGAAPAVSAVGTEQFGLCLDQDSVADNATNVYPTNSSNLVDGLADAVVDASFTSCGAGYEFTATASGALVPVLNTIASSTGPVAMTWFDVEYLTNISAITEAGLYTTDLTFITTGLF